MTEENYRKEHLAKLEDIKSALFWIRFLMIYWLFKEAIDLTIRAWYKN